VRRALVQTLTFLLALALLAACATEASAPPSGLDFEGDELNPSGDLDEEIDGPIAPDTGLDGEDAPTSDQVVEAALTDVEAFWHRTYEDVYGEPYEPISGGFWAYGPDSEQPPCGVPRPVYEDIAQNAFYCPSADLVAWDDVNLIPQLYEEFGGFTLGIVFAHELGHAVQARARTTGPTVLLELQADCFAGAWAAAASQTEDESGVPFLQPITREQYSDAISAAAAVGDDRIQETMQGQVNPHTFTHGSSEQRVRWFETGYQGGAGACDTFSVAQL
jgi:predicted metalloprotease